MVWSVGTLPAHPGCVWDNSRSDFDVRHTADADKPLHSPISFVFWVINAALGWFKTDVSGLHVGPIVSGVL